MTLTPHGRATLTLAGTALLTVALVPGLAQLPAVASPGSTPAGHTSTHTVGDPVAGVGDTDVRGTVAPLASQVAAVRDLGATTSRWNDFGTPASILPDDGSLGAASGRPVDAARGWLQAHADAFGLTADQLDADSLELVNNQQLAQSSARAVLFRQRYGDLAAASGGLVTVGVAHGEIAYVSSSLVRDPGTPAAATLSPLAAWRAAAKDVGLGEVDVSGITTRVSGGWTRFQVPDVGQEQMVRLRALGMADGTVRPVFVTNVIDVAAGDALAYTVLVDAVTGEVLVRHNQVDSSNGVEGPFQGSFTATDCGPKHPFELTDGKTRTISMTAVAAPTDDVTIKLYDPSGTPVFTQDLLTSPETGTYSTDTTLEKGTWSAAVCPFDAASAVVGQYSLTVVTSDQAADTGTSTPNPRWRYFLANPTLDSPSRTPRNSVVGCWLFRPKQCDDPPGSLANIAAFGPWDTDINGVPTFTTVGNNASTHEAWGSPLTPGGTAQAPYSPTRDYTEKFTDAWNNNQCDPTQLTPGGNDINASVTNLFVAHNRMHDFSYYLGFTERNYNLQAENGGRGGAAGDPEIGNAQAGALTGGQPSYLGRDNANQITLQDGTPGITNQYLFQPIAGAFYAPCTDGGMDMGIVGHEYTHAISNRMIAGPDEGITSEQGGAMGESWGDLVAAEYQFEHGYRNGGNTWAVGLYATGNKKVAIRDYAINHNPLNYSDYGFDTTGPEVHADGEIWNGTQWEVRQALVRRYDDRFHYGSEKLQRRCAQALPDRANYRPNRCPGNRRWLQLMFDSFLLQQGATSMLDARDAMIAADQMRFHGKDAKALWDAYARRGMGKGASTPSADAANVRASFASPRSRNATVRFRAPRGGKVYVGRYEARATPVADTIARTKLDRRVRFTPGRYQVLVTAPDRVAKRVTFRVRAGQHRTVRIRTPRNLAGKVLASSPGSRNAAFLVDGTEATNWGGVNDDGTNVDEQHPFVSVDLRGKQARVVRTVNVSALLRPAAATDDPLPVLRGAQDDPDSGSRFTALRRFALERCVRACGSDNAEWKPWFRSSAKAFPSVRPRPVAPDQTLRVFDVPDRRARAVRFVALENQCTGYAGYAGEQDNDPLNDTDCKTASDRGSIVHAAELQLY